MSMSALKGGSSTVPSKEDTEAELAGASFFTKLDANQGFSQIPLDNCASKVGTFSTLFARYCFL